MRDGELNGAYESHDINDMTHNYYHHSLSLSLAHSLVHMYLMCFWHSHETRKSFKIHFECEHKRNYFRKKRQALNG